MIKSEGDSPSSRRASSVLSVYSASALGEATVLNVNEVAPPSTETVEEETCSPLLKKHKMQFSRNEEDFCEMDDMYENDALNAETEQFCVADVRRRLADHLNTPKKMFSRDPEDPSGWFDLHC